MHDRSHQQIDSAVMYRNEKGCGLTIKDSGIDRSEIFYTTKILPSAMGHRRTAKQVDDCLRESELDYIDLFVTVSFPQFNLLQTNEIGS